MLKKLFENRSVGVHLILAIVFSILLFFFSLLFLNFFTRHGKKVQVPNLHGKNLEEAVMLLEDKGLKYEIIDSIYSEEATPGSVIDYSPQAGSQVKPGRLIFLTINATSPKQVAIPQVKDLSERQAWALLHSLGFGQISKRLVAAAYDGLAVEVQTMGGKSLAPGDRISINTPIVLVVTIMATNLHGEGADSLSHHRSDSLHYSSGQEAAAAVQEDLTDDESWF